MVSWLRPTRALVYNKKLQPVVKAFIKIKVLEIIETLVSGSEDVISLQKMYDLYGLKSIYFGLDALVTGV